MACPCFLSRVPVAMYQHKCSGSKIAVNGILVSSCAAVTQSISISIHGVGSQTFQTDVLGVKDRHVQVLCGLVCLRVHACLFVFYCRYLA